MVGDELAVFDVISERYCAVALPAAASPEPAVKAARMLGLVPIDERAATAARSLRCEREGALYLFTYTEVQVRCLNGQW
jgi:hypothetical protein